MLLTSPPGDNTVPAADPLFSDLAAALAQGYAIQTFFIPVLRKNLNTHMYKTLLIATYIAGISVYTFIGYTGSFSNHWILSKVLLIEVLKNQVELKPLKTILDKKNGKSSHLK